MPKYIVNYSHDNGRNAWGVASKTVTASSPEGALQIVQSQYPGEQIKVTTIK
jgi:hypothetical protein